MQETLYQKADAKNTLSDNGCRRLSIKHRMQESLYKTAYAGDYQSAIAGDSLSDRGCGRHSIRQRMQKSPEFAV